MKKVFLLCNIIVLAINFSITAQSTIGPNYAHSGITGGGSGIAWTNPGNIAADDNIYTTAAIGNNGTSQALNATDFGFSIPTDAVIAGIKVTIGRFCNSSDPNLIRDNSVQLIKDGSVVGGNKAITATNWPSSEAVADYGGESDLWGTIWTPADINASNFGIQLVVKNSGYNSHTASVDYIQMTIYLAGPPAEEPTTQASNVTFSLVEATQITINWTSGDGTNRLVLIKTGSQVDSDPVDGVSYTANTTFGNGTQIGTGNYIVYNGTSNSVAVSGLSSNTIYHTAVYEFNGTSGSQNYLTVDPAIGSQLTLPTPANFTGTELLGRPTDHSITLNVIASTALDAYVKYGVTSGVYTNSTATVSKAANDPIEILIDGLDANAKYYYRFVYSSDGGSNWIERDEHTFHTQRPSGSSFTFTITSDSHLGQYGGQTSDELALYTLTLQNVAKDNPDFHLDLGDTFAMDPLPPYGNGLGNGMTEENADAAYALQRPYLGQICHSIPFYYALGNHENEEGWNWDDDSHFTLPNKSLSIVGIKARKKYIPNPVPNGFYTGNDDPLPYQFLEDYPDTPDEENFREDYYAWTWGDALFVVIDPFQYSMTWPNESGNNGYGGEGQDGEVSGDRWDWTLGIKQYLWLKNTLENSNATYKFVFSHHVAGGETSYGRGGISAAPYFEWGGKNADGSWGWDTHRPASEGWDVPIHQLMVKNGVNIYFHGHDHIYAYEELDGIVYLECPKPDDAGYDWQPYGYGETEGLYPDGYMLPNSGHIRVNVSPTEVTASYVRSYLPGNGTNGVIGHAFTINCPSITVNAKVFLQSSYSGSSMSTALNSILPTSQPYYGLPWSYSGLESVTDDFFSTHTDITDWILIELRKTYNGARVGRRAAFLKNDGIIVDIDGSSPVVFHGKTAGNYYIVIRHRNHLAVMSADSVLLSSSSTLYDFTLSQNQAYGTSSMAELVSGVFGMISGDANGDGIVDVSDRNDTWNDRLQSGYKNSDVTLDGIVDVSDRNDAWNKRLLQTRVP
jgi:hypothetical protein